MMLSLYWLSLVAVSVVVAQNSSNVVNCTDSQNYWTFNSLGQSPCEVADVLADQCTGQAFTVPSLNPGQEYIISTSISLPCFCNTVWYSLLSACAACQNRTWYSWPLFSQECDQTYLMLYPDPVLPGTTSVPRWAYLNVTATNDTFNLAAASSLAAETTSTYSVPFTSTLTSTSASTSTSPTPASASTSLTPASTSNSTSDPSKIGAITGGIVGGRLVIVGLLVMTFLLYLHRRRSGLIADTPPQVNVEDTDRISTNSPQAGLESTPQGELSSDPRRPPGQSPRPSGGGEFDRLEGGSIWNSGAGTWIQRE